MLSPEEEEGGIDGWKDRKVNQFSDRLATLYTWHVQRCRWASFQGSWCSIFSADCIERYQIYVHSPTKCCGTIKCVAALNRAPVQLPSIKANLYRYTWLRICYIVWVHWQTFTGVDGARSLNWARGGGIILPYRMQYTNARFPCCDSDRLLKVKFARLQWQAWQTQTM